MGISSALYTGVSGLKTNGQAMTVIGNNLANTNTIGYKGSRSIFSDLLSASVSGSGGNSQVGRGVGLSRVDNLFSQGTFESTESGLDLAIEGDSFFMLSPEGEDRYYYSRAGAFSFNHEGIMVNPEGLRVQGILYDANGELIGGNPSDIYVDRAGLVGGRATDTLTLTTNLDSTAPILTSDPFDASDPSTYSYMSTETGLTTATAGDTVDVNLYYRKINSNEWEVYYDATRNSGTPADDGSTSNIVGPTNMMLDNSGLPVASPGGGSFDPIPSGTTFNWTSGSATSTSTAAATINNATLTQELASSSQTYEFDYTDPTTFNYSASVEIFDSLGNPHLLTHYFRKADNNTWHVYYSAETEDGTIIPSDPTAVPPTDPNTNVMKILAFGSEGQPIDSDTGVDLVDPPQATTALLDWGNGSEPTAAVINFDTTQFNSKSIVISQNQNGYGAGNFAGVSIDEDGNVIASYSNGETRTVAAITLARFVNPLGLSMEGSNLFAATTKSGAARVGIPGPELGAVVTNSLEQSNVDMGAEFVKMITTQRGYQANSKIITTVDSMLEELINLKR